MKRYMGHQLILFFEVRTAITEKENRNGFATVYTPMGSPVIVITISDAEFTVQQKEQINTVYRKDYPKAT